MGPCGRLEVKNHLVHSDYPLKGGGSFPAEVGASGPRGGWVCTGGQPCLSVGTCMRICMNVSLCLLRDLINKENVRLKIRVPDGVKFN